MRHTLFALIFFLLTNCSSNSYEEIHTSPSSKYKVEVYVGDREDKNDKYNLTLRLVDNNNTELDYLNTRSSDIMKWAIVWYDNKTIVLDSHDLGTLSWVIKDDKFQEVSTTEEMTEIAELAFRQKYN